VKQKYIKIILPESGSGYVVHVNVAIARVFDAWIE
jgi:hypothetical protein